jgi:membrane-bound ClpP family serine protease
VSDTRRYVSPTRQAQASATRRAILEAFAEQLSEAGRDRLSPSEAAVRAGVSLRTVHAHFPNEASQVAALALAIGVVFLLEGAVASVVALTHRHVKGWGWGLTNGLVTLVLGLMILTMKSLSLLWVLGSLVGISFLFSGLDLLTFSASFHHARSIQPGPGDNATG